MGQGGVKDLKRHEQTDVHSRAEKSNVRAIRISAQSGTKQRSRLKLNLSLFLENTTLHALCLADHAAKLFASMFPDSTIAKEFKCSHTKATAILKVIA